MTSTRKRKLTVLVLILSVNLFALITSVHLAARSTAMPVALSTLNTATSSPVFTNESSYVRTKGIIFDPVYVVNGLAGAPSFATLKNSGFNLVGVIAYYKFGTSQWASVGKWISGAKAAGLTTLINVWGDRQDQATMLEMAEHAGGAGADIIALDEPLTTYKMTEAQLQFIIDSVVSSFPNQRFMINEYNPSQIRDAYAWTAKYSFVTVATDDYYSKGTIDFGMQVAQSYQKTPAAWLIFAQGSKNFDSYVHLDSWLAYVKQKNVDVLFWYIDAANTWKAQWPQVTAF